MDKKVKILAGLNSEFLSGTHSEDIRITVYSASNQTGYASSIDIMKHALDDSSPDETFYQFSPLIHNMGCQRRIRFFMCRSYPDAVIQLPFIINFVRQVLFNIELQGFYWTFAYSFITEIFDIPSHKQRDCFMTKSVPVSKIMIDMATGNTHMISQISCLDIIEPSSEEERDCTIQYL